MSTRGSLYYHRDPSTGVTIHIYHESVAVDTRRGLRLEVEHRHGLTNVAWPANWATTEKLLDADLAPEA